MGVAEVHCQPRGQSLPPPLLWTQTLHLKTEGQPQHTEALTGSWIGARPTVWSHTQPAGMLCSHTAPAHPQERDPTTATPQAPFLGG